MANETPHSTDKHVGSRVRMRRVMLGMNQSALGDALGVSLQQVHKYENGANRIGASRLQQAAHALQVPVSFFFEVEPNSTGQSGSVASSQDYVSAFVTSADGINLVRAFSAVKDAKLRRAIVDLVKGIAGDS
jgi:transcriptional regulator with XRE-family HTH domain